MTIHYCLIVYAIEFFIPLLVWQVLQIDVLNRFSASPTLDIYGSRPFALSQAAPTAFRRTREMVPTGHATRFLTHGRWFGTQGRWFEVHAPGLFRVVEQPDINSSP